MGAGAQDDTNNGVQPNSKEEFTDTEKQSTEYQYKHRKPKWWTHRSRKGSKSQRRAIDDMKEYSLMRTPYGKFIDWNSAFRRNDSGTLSIWLEIGFGAGDNLLKLAEQYPEKCFVGAETHQPGVGKAMQKIKYGTENKCYWKGSSLYSTEVDPGSEQPASDRSENAVNDNVYNGNGAIQNPYFNVRLYRGDGVQFLATVLSGTLEAVLVTNPDPFPGDDEKEWRLLQIPTLREIRRVLKPSGRLYLATDHGGFHSWSHEIIGATNEPGEIFRIIDPHPSRHLWLPVVSEYEQRGLENGRRPILSCWEAV